MVLLESCYVMVWPGHSQCAETAATLRVKSPLSAGLQGSCCTSRRTSGAGDMSRWKVAHPPYLLPEATRGNCPWVGWFSVEFQLWLFQPSHNHTNSLTWCSACVNDFLNMIIHRGLAQGVSALLVTHLQSLPRALESRSVLQLLHGLV